MFGALKNLSKETEKLFRVGYRPIRLLNSTAKRLGSFEPHDLKLTPDIPEYEQLQILVQGYDYVTLESFAKYVHSIARSFQDPEFIIKPPQNLKVQTFKPNSSIVASEYLLKKYSRTFQFNGLPSTVLPILLDMIHTHVPQGIDITVRKPVAEEDEALYVPSTSRDTILKQIHDMNEAKKDKRKKLN